MAPHLLPHLNFLPYWEGIEGLLGAPTFLDWAKDFAAKSGISRSALQRLERGHEGARLLTFLVVLRTLGRIEAMESVVPRDEPTPMELAEAKSPRPPKRVRRRKGESAGEWKWGNAR